MHAPPLPRTASWTTLDTYCRAFAKPRSEAAPADDPIDAFVHPHRDEAAVAAGRRLLNRAMQLPVKAAELRQAACDRIVRATAARAPHVARARVLIEGAQIDGMLQRHLEVTLRQLRHRGASPEKLAILRGHAQMAVKAAASGPVATFFLAEQLSVACLRDCIDHDAHLGARAMQLALERLPILVARMGEPHALAALSQAQNSHMAQAEAFVAVFDPPTFDTLHDLPEALRRGLLLAVCQALPEPDRQALTEFFKTPSGTAFRRAYHRLMGMMQHHASWYLRGVLG